MEVERPPALARLGAPRHHTPILIVFTAAVFTSALLLFAVQPMFTRMVLPRLGGAPSVWSVAMVFFQSMLLAGYAYAHALSKAARPLVTVAVHLALLVLASLTLPLSIAGGWGAPPAAGEAFWLVGLFAVSIGLPFFALSANNPLLQAWFVRTGHRDAADPYFLYAASNFGSFLALLSYPFLIEPLLPLQAQLSLWSAGFYLLVALIAACGFVLVKAAQPHAVADRAASEAARPPTWRDTALWVFLAAVPSGLLVAVTAHISTDVAAAPLLWVVPLSLYLLTWILVFQTRPLLPHRWVMRLHPLAIVALVVVFARGWDQDLTVTLLVHLVAFFVIAMACHGELARRRPHPAYLTGFYLSLSFGGMIGGVFAGLAAPHLFSWIAEYPILIVLAVLCRPMAAASGRRGARLFWLLAVVAALALLIPGVALRWSPTEAGAKTMGWMVAAAAVASLALVRDPRKFALAIAVALALPHVYPPEGGRFERVRSFFGVHKIQETGDGQFRVLMHGTTIHGAQRIRDQSGRPVSGRPEPLTFYHADSPLAQGIRALRERKGAPLKVAAIGLGTGSLACHRAPGDAWRYFEIDPDVIRIARDPRRFTFLEACAPDLPIVQGDARLTLAREPDQAYDLIIVDAFSSDSIPVHLLTREAMAVYRRKLAPHGAVMMHVSNRHLELASVAAGIAAANGFKTWVNHDEDNEDRDDEYVFSSSVAIAAADEADLGRLTTQSGWESEEPDPDQKTWTDDYSNILGAIIREQF
ncbi:MAG TPA: fused MFS/spermidine synthase [Beijerinckiaceae bacterium]|jgi:hypothetical protein